MDRVETRELAYFVAVAEALHFTRAAEELGISQPPLSRAIARLERRMGVALLRRTSRGVSLTEAGKRFLVDSRAILAAVDGAVRDARRTDEPLRVTLAVRPAAAPGVLSALLDAPPPPGGTTDVVFTYDAVGALRDGTADIALMCRSTAVPGLQMIDLGGERPVALLPGDHPAADRPVLSLSEVEALDGYRADMPEDPLDVIVDKVALGHLIVVIGDDAVDRLGSSVRAVPVEGYPTTTMVLAWLPGAAGAVTHLVRAARESTFTPAGTSTPGLRVPT